MTLSSGTHVGPYQIVAALGAGGMGEVYRARDTRLHRDVAVKVLPSSFSQDADRLRRFEQEARAASALNHPGILTIHDFGSEGGAPYVVTELLEGETLREKLSGGRLAVRKCLDYGAQVARGLAAAHERGIVHRDLKPENLFVTKDGRVKILDFGLAKLTLPERSTAPLTKVPTQTAGTEPGLLMGTVGYMAPEQVRGLPADTRSDIFSLGAVLYEMLTGERAFRGDTAVETMNAILKEEPPGGSLSTLEIPAALARTVWRCLEKSPEERYQSARDLGYALEEAAASASAPPLAVTPPVPRRRPALRFALLGIAAAVVAILVFRAVTREKRGEAAEPIRSLVVLPLENLSRDPEQEFFSDGMTEELIAELGKLRALRVISRTSAMRYRRTTKSVPEIARELDVDAVVEGSVLKSGDRVRITAQLIQAATDRHLWSESYERDLKDVLALQSEVAQAIAREIRVTVSPQEQAQLAKSRTVDPEAHRLYLLGRFWWNKRNPEGFQKALEFFEKAIAKDPTFAAAYAGLSDTYAVIGYYHLVRPREVFPKARAAAERALELDDALAEAHASVGNIDMTYDQDWAAAEREYRRSIELNPGYATAHQWYSILLTALGRLEEARAEIRRAQELDPLSLIIDQNVGLQQYFARRYDEAIREYRRILEMDPGFRVTKIMLLYAYAERGMFREAIAEGEKASARDLQIKAAMAYLHARVGNRPQALRLLQELKGSYGHDDVTPESIAIVYTGLGEKDEAFAWLDKAYEERTPFVLFLKPSPYYDPLRADSRFAELLRRVGLPP
ncbi:MAG TPA: protein kinase [Thermoanaerobaculia bacterium]